MTTNAVRVPTDTAHVVGGRDKKSRVDSGFEPYDVLLDSTLSQESITVDMLTLSHRSACHRRYTHSLRRDITECTLVDPLPAHTAHFRSARPDYSAYSGHRDSHGVELTIHRVY